MKKGALFVFVLLITVLSTFSVWAGELKKESEGRYWYQNDDGTRMINQWIELEGKQYYFDSDGYMLLNTFTPDDKEVGEDGAWTGVIKSYAQREEEFLQSYRDYLDLLFILSQNENYISVLTEMEKQDYKNMVDSIPKGGYCYPTDNGIGLKIQNNYLFYGELINGLAQGNGIAYNVISKKKNTARYGYYDGAWDNDAPNGYGIELIYSNNGKAVTNISGNYINWYQDGDMTSVYQFNNKIKTYHYKVANKFPIGIGKARNSHGVCKVVAYPEENNGGYLTFYDTAQTAAHINIDDGIKKNSYGYWGD